MRSLIFWEFVDIYRQNFIFFSCAHAWEQIFQIKIGLYFTIWRRIVLADVREVEKSVLKINFMAERAPFLPKLLSGVFRWRVNHNDSIFLEDYKFGVKHSSILKTHRNVNKLRADYKLVNTPFWALVQVWDLDILHLIDTFFHELVVLRVTSMGLNTFISVETLTLKSFVFHKFLDFRVRWLLQFSIWQQF